MSSVLCNIKGRNIMVYSDVPITNRLNSTIRNIEDFCEELIHQTCSVVLSCQAVAAIEAPPRSWCEDISYDDVNITRAVHTNPEGTEWERTIYVFPDDSDGRAVYVLLPDGSIAKMERESYNVLGSVPQPDTVMRFGVFPAPTEIDDGNVIAFIRPHA